MAEGECDVLVVDDQPPVRQMMRLMLGQFGFSSIDLARDGVEAMERLVAVRPKLVITDINMPNMNGLEFLQCVRCGDTAAPRDLPVLILTGRGESAIASTAVALDVNGFVLKPASPANLKLRLERTLNSERRKPKDDWVYRSVPIPDITADSVVFPLSELVAPPGGRVVPLTDEAVGKTIFAPVLSRSGASIVAKGDVISQDILVSLLDLAEIGLVQPGIIVAL